MIPRKKHATVATVLVFVVLVILTVFFLMREEEVEPQLVSTPMLTAHDVEVSVSVSGESNEVRQERARAKLLEHYTEVGTGG